MALMGHLSSLVFRCSHPTPSRTAEAVGVCKLLDADIAKYTDSNTVSQMSKVMER
jgi:hypothetical protein